MIESAINFLKENESRVHWYSFEGKIVTFFRCFCLYERHVHSKQTGIAIGAVCGVLNRLNTNATRFIHPGG